jgi:epoxyqueuosine reductase
VPERYWAYRAGIGFPGKNTLLVIPGAGSYFFLGELFLNLEADAYDEPIGNRCGSCTRCLDACPTHALYEPYRMDARRCLSYLTIENRGSIPPEAAKAMETCIYGCDRCQRACPYNKAAKPTDVDDFRPDARLLGMTPDDWKNLTEEQYCELFRASAVKRAKYSGLMRNIRAVGQGGEEK